MIVVDDAKLALKRETNRSEYGVPRSEQRVLCLTSTIDFLSISTIEALILTWGTTLRKMKSRSVYSE